jgi:hypothetical protein
MAGLAGVMFFAAEDAIRVEPWGAAPVAAMN